jgi:hypothetical protein
LQIYADGGYQLRIRSLEGTPNYGPRQIVLPEILSPSIEVELPKVAKAPATTPKRRRMASVLDAVMETTRAQTPTPVKIAAKAVAAHVETEAGPSAPAEAEPAAIEQGAEKSFQMLA